MSKETYIWIAFCVFAFMVGMRLKKRFGKKREQEQEQVRINKNQRPKQAREEQGKAPAGRRNRKKTLRLFMILQMTLVFGLMVYIIPALLRDLTRIGSVDATNLFLRVLIFIFALLVFITSYLKLVRQGKQKDQIK
ncbi:hypothetical protein [uncultured Sanguibacteroides sp.]|uniref:hypothetical protein n=1 Tax=uncultured Sanguibacteroides sp. TaxID=1635151 RepID=UPI0025D8B78C|nr:hypothetical protein [uncultured Sanguibacteroides sp.]